MKNIDIVIINWIIHYFNRISATIKTDNRISFRKSLNGTGAYFTLKRMKNILFADTMPKSRLIELNDNIHRLNILQTKLRNNYVPA